MMKDSCNSSRWVRVCAWFFYTTLFITPIHAQEVVDLPLGATEELVIETYGMPMIKVDIPNSNQQIWSYPNKNIVMEENRLKMIDRSMDHTFGEGSDRLQLILAQGFPDSIYYLASLDQELWHYDTALVTLKDGIVLEWSDHNHILSLLKPDESTVNVLTIGLNQHQIIDIAGSPHSVQRFPTIDEEIWHYAGNYLTFKSGKLLSFDQQEKDAKSFRGIFRNDGDPETSEMLSSVAQHVGIASATDGISSSTGMKKLKSDFQGVLKSDGRPETAETLALVREKNASHERMMDDYGAIAARMKIRRLFLLDDVIEPAADSIENASPNQPFIKAATNVHRIFGFEF